MIRIDSDTPRPRARKKPPKTLAMRRGCGADAARLLPTPPHLAAAEAVFARWARTILVGEAPFGELRAEFSAWCEAADVAPVSDTMLARWLVQAGLEKRRVGRAKITVYVKYAARSVDARAA